MESKGGSTLTHFAGLVALLLVMSATAAQAQNVQSSNSSATIVTTGDAAGGAFVKQFGVRARFVNAGVQARVNQAAAELNVKLAQGVLVLVPLASTENVVPSAFAAQQNLSCIMMTAEAGNDECEAMVTSALSSAQQSEVVVRELVTSVQGLTAGDDVDATRLVQALSAFNKFVALASTDFLAAPSEEFVVIHTVLSKLVGAASDAS